MAPVVPFLERRDRETFWKLLGFRHSIAGAVEAFYLANGGRASWGAMLGDSWCLP